MKRITLERAQFLLSIFLRLTILIAVGGALYNRNWAVLFASVLAYIMTFLPSIFEKNYKISLPAEFEIAIVLFLYAALFLGEVHDYYTIFWWWDVILHAGSAMALGLIGFLILYVMYKEHRIQAKPFTIALFSFCFALSMGALWEIFEYTMDVNFGLNMQKSGLRDTMWDLIIDAIGAFIASVMGYFYIKGKRTPVFEHLINKFADENPKIYKVGLHKRK